jgi:hypothetical protein
MSDPVYVTRLGSDLYLDDLGVLHQGPIPPVPSYAMPGGVLATANEIGKLSKTFKDIGGALPNKEDGERFDKFAAKLSKLGLPGDDMAKLLGVVGKIADAVGTVFVVVGAAVALAKMLGMFNEGPSPLEVLVQARFDALDREIRALQKLEGEKEVNRLKNDLISARSTVQTFVSQRDSGTMTTAQIESRLQTLVTNLQLLSANEFISLLDPITYMAFFDSDEYMKVWPWISGHLFRVPAGLPPQRAAFPAVNSPFFDHRIAVPLAAQTAQTFLVLVRSLSPEFRTTGDFRPTLRDFADKLSNIAATLRNTALARTIYSEGDFGFLITDFYVNDPLPGIIDPILKPDYSFVVGAMDLCNHNDAFFPNVVKGFGVPTPAPSRQGSFDFRWHPPARIVRDPVPSGLVHNDGTPIIQYRIVNHKECADAANDLSLQDYSDLLISSGYLTLVQLAAQLRHAATQPDKSETVHGDVLLQRHPQPRSEVTVVSAPGPILFTPTGEITAKASREPQKVRAFAACSTQLIPRAAPLIQYRVLLRTLSSAFPPGGWGEPDYNSVQSANYMADPLHPGFQRLVLSTSFDAVLQEELLMEGSSQTEARHIERTLTFRAHTFDWWIAVKPLHGGVSGSAFATATEHEHVFGNGPARPPVGLPKLSPKSTLLGIGSIDIAKKSAASVVLGLGWEDGAQTWQGQHREMLETTIQMHVKLDWQGSNIHVAIENRPEDRNYLVFLVVEEKFGSTESDEQAPKVLHTAFPIPINGQLTYVPQSFFDEEREANNKQRAFAEDFAISVNPKPGEPVFGTISMGELATDAGVARLAAALRQFEPRVLEKLTRTPHVPVQDEILKSLS